MKFLYIIFAVLQVSVSAQAARDSVGVFLKSDKAVVLINEYRGGANRVQQFLMALGGKPGVSVATADQSFRVKCVVNTNQDASCTFGFAPTSQVEIQPKSLLASESLKNLGLPEADDFEMYFESSLEDRFELKIRSGVLQITAKKR